MYDFHTSGRLPASAFPGASSGLSGVRGRRRVARGRPPSVALSRCRPRTAERSNGQPCGGRPLPLLDPPLTKLITSCIITATVAHVIDQYWSYHTRSLTRQRADNIAVHSRGLTGVSCFYIPGSYAHRSGGREASILVQGWQPTQTACPEGGSPRQSPAGPRTLKETCPVVCCRPTGRGYLPGSLWPGQHMAAGILDGRDEPILVACSVASDKGVTIRSKPQTLAYQIH